MSTPVTAEHLQPGQVVMIVTARTPAQGFIGKLFKILAIDWPYGCLLWLESSTQWRYTEDLRAYDFVIPSPEYVQAVVPEESWPEEVG